MTNDTLPADLTAAEYNALDPYTRAVYDETLRERRDAYRAATPFSFSWCQDRAAEDAAKAARAYNATGERIEFPAPRVKGPAAIEFMTGANA